MDERLRRRKGLEDSEASPSSNGHLGDGVTAPSGLSLLAAPHVLLPPKLCSVLARCLRNVPVLVVPQHSMCKTEVNCIRQPSSTDHAYAADHRGY